MSADAADKKQDKTGCVNKDPNDLFYIETLRSVSERRVQRCDPIIIKNGWSIFRKGHGEMKLVKLINKFLRWVIRKSPKLRKFIFKLYNAINQGGYTIKNRDHSTPAPEKKMIEQKPKPVEKSIFNEKSMFSGYSIDYLNSKFLSRQEREGELKRLFYNHTKYYLDLENPKTFNQKLQWLKLNYHDPEIGRCVDKCEFKKYIDEKLGEGYTVPMYGFWEHENHIDFDKLPDKFVLKSNVQSDGRHIIVVKDKSQLDIDKLKTVMSSWLLRRNTLCASYCNAYVDVQPKILAEEYLEGFDDTLTDYKFMCFNGKAEMLFVVADRKKKMCVNFYDLDWNLLPFTRVYPNTDYPLPKPKNFDLMLELANKLAKPFPFVRVDFYESADGEKVYVGELTFYPGGGYETFQPMEWDYKLGDMLKLPEANY